MMEIGKIQKLKVIKEKDFGIYLSDGDKADAQGVLLPKKQVPEGTKIGDSIAVNGVCLTVTNMKNNEFSADVMAETVRRSSLGALRDGSYVNLDLAMAADGRFGGHIVSGHIDGTGQIESMRREENAVWVTIACTDKILDLIVEKGSICIDGISLTVAAVTKRNFSVSVIPHTGEETTLLKKKAGDAVNLENDIVGKYIQKFPDGDNAAGNAKGNPGLSMEFLQKYGF